MSKPFNASSVIKTIFGRNNLEVTFVDQFGRKQVVNLSPQSRRNLMLALLAKAPLHQLEKLTKEGEPPLPKENVFEIIGVTSLLLEKDKPGLELHLSKEMSFYISFLADDIQKFQIALSDLEKALMTPTTH